MATWVSASMIPLLQVQPLLGRSFSADEEVRGGPEAVILSESEWRTRFGAAQDVIGKTLMVNSVSRQIVGVMPAQFAFPRSGTRVWLPAKLATGSASADVAYWGVARLAPGATMSQLQEELATLLPSAQWLAEVNSTPVVRSLLEDQTRAIAGTLSMLSAAAVLVLLVAWANVVNLMLIRADDRQLELGVREALGASRLPIVSHFLGEALLLNAIGGIFALLLTCGTVRILAALGPSDIPRISQLHVGFPVVGFTAMVSIIGVVLCVVTTAVRVRHGRLSHRLRDGARGKSIGRFRQRLRSAITVMQIALALVVSVGSALLLRTAQRLSDMHPGFEASEVMTLRTQLPFARYDETAAAAFYTKLAEQVSQLPSVYAAGLTMRVPLDSTEERSMSFYADSGSFTLPVNIADPGYFSAMRIPRVAGANFGRNGPTSSEVIIDLQAAKTLFGDPTGFNALGKRLTLASASQPGPSSTVFTVVGVVGDVRARDLSMTPTAMVYLPITAPETPRSLALVVHSSVPADALVTRIRNIVQTLDPSVSVFNVETMNDVVRGSTARLSLALTLMSAAATITLLLGAIGLYGVMSTLVAMRTPEFGVRITLGAAPQRIARSVMHHALVLCTGGILLGLLIYWLTVPFLRAFLYGVTASDPPTLIAVTLILIGTALLASWLPASRAASVDPVQALRAD